LKSPNHWVLEIEEIRAVPFVPGSHPFIERLIGPIRREYLDHDMFWNQADPRRKLGEFASYYNDVRVHSAVSGTTPADRGCPPSTRTAGLQQFSWQAHCHGLFRHRSLPDQQCAMDRNSQCVLMRRRSTCIQENHESQFMTHAMTAGTECDTVRHASRPINVRPAMLLGLAGLFWPAERRSMLVNLSPRLHDSSFAAASRRILCSPCQTDPWRAASRIFPHGCLRLIGILRAVALTDWSVGVWRHNTRSGNAAEDTVRLISESGSVEQRGERLIGVAVSKY
jgi:Integrase core domain